MRLVLAAGTTETAAIDGLSAAGAEPALREHTPGADAEILASGRPVRSPVVPMSPTGCPTPAAVTRAVRELVGLRLTVLEAGLPQPIAIETVDLDASPGADVREPVAVPDAGAVYAAARDRGRDFPTDEHLLLAETIPGGTTTALGVLEALGEPATVSSSLANNPLERKREVVDAGLAASDLDPGEAAADPLSALRAMGDPVLVTLAGFAAGAIETGVPVTLAGGTQLLAVAACLRHRDVAAPLDLATTSFLRADPTAHVAALADALDVTVTTTDPGFDAVDHPAAGAYCRGEAKEGVGMGGALHLVDRSDTPMNAVRDRFLAVSDRLADHARAPSEGRP
jgi:uncharacterized protein (TIGR00303 family)